MATTTEAQFITKYLDIGAFTIAAGTLQLIASGASNSDIVANLNDVLEETGKNVPDSVRKAMTQALQKEGL